MPNILFVATHRPDRSPSQRFRFEQYLNFLSENGYKCDFSWLVTTNDDHYLYRRGHYLRKLLFLIKSYGKRMTDMKRAPLYDIIYVQREALLFRSEMFEKAFSKRSKLIFDFDDAIWLMDVSEGNKHWKWLKRPSKTSDIIGFSHLVFAGNRYLYDYARQFNDNVKIIPTTIDTEYHKKISRTCGIKKKNNRICIGWTGSDTTLKHFMMAEVFLEKIKKKYGDRIYFKVIGSDLYENPQLCIKSIPWRLETEIQDLSEIDIGIMPLPPDEWAKGKCGFKGLQYMSMEIPTVMSPVGVNTEIVQDGVNGFLASTEDEWIEKISMLIESEELRIKLGTNGRKTVVERYSVESQKFRYLEYFNELINS